MLPSGGRTAEESKWNRLEMDALSGTRRREVPKVRAAQTANALLVYLKFGVIHAVSGALSRRPERRAFHVESTGRKGRFLAK